MWIEERAVVECGFVRFRSRWRWGWDESGVGEGGIDESGFAEGGVE